MNNKGQTLVIFIILLPIFCILLGYVVDQCYMLSQKNSLKNISQIICEYALDTNRTEDEIRQLALENDKGIKNIDVEYFDSEVRVLLTKKAKSIFSKLIGKDEYLVEVKSTCME